MIEIEKLNGSGVGKVDIWEIINFLKKEALLVIYVKKWAILFQSADVKAK